MKNRKQYELIEIGGQFKAAVVGSDPQQTCYLIESPKTREAALDEIRRMNAVYYLSDYAHDEIEEFWQSLDMKPVNEFFGKMLNLPVNLAKHSSYTDEFTMRHSLSDNANIADANPITAAAWSKMKVCNFGGGVYVDKSTGALCYAASINLSYEHWSGGTNGAQIGSVRYVNGAWQLESERAKREGK